MIINNKCAVKNTFMHVVEKLYISNNTNTKKIFPAGADMLDWFTYSLSRLLNMFGIKQPTPFSF